jgi:hypothetical protein
VAEPQGADPVNDRDIAPGLRFPPLDTSKARQLTAHDIQSTAVHSKSRGWLPMVKLDLTHIPLVGPGRSEKLELIISPDALDEMMKVLEMAMRRAHADAAVGLVKEIPEL